jgi:hypothetical protein
MFNNSLNLKTYSAESVFGMSRDLPLNYVIRKNVDEKLIDRL